jgi:hypothetical protein
MLACLLAFALTAEVFAQSLKQELQGLIATHP